MFEALVTGLLTNALGSYIDPECFSADKISVAVWDGYVVLHDLEVKPEVFADLPALRLVRGVVGSLELKIPRWNRLQSESVVATLDDVYLLVQTEEDLDAVMMAMDEFTLKKRLLEELYKQAKRQEEEQEPDATASEDGFAARLINKIIDNLELHIRMIHVRVEDQSSGDHPFALGLTIESVHAQSTNSNWQRSYVDTYKSNEPRIFKIVELNHLSVYLNPDCELLRDRSVDFEVCPLDDFSNAFKRAIPKRFDRHHFQHHFLLKPIDASARLIVNRDVFDASVPAFEVDVSIPDVAFRLEESQYCDLLYLASAMQVPDHYAKYQRYRKMRPQATVFDEPVLWWQYAIKAVVEDTKEKRQRWTWGYMKDRREDRKRYVSLWQQKSIQLLELTDVDYILSDSEDNGGERNGDVGDSGDAASQDGERESVASSTGYSSPPKSLLELDFALEEIERRRTVEDVLFFRYLADQNLRKRQASRAPRRKHLTPPMHRPREFSDSESVDTELSEPSVPSEVQYRSWGAWMFGWTSKLTGPAADGEHGDTPRRVIPDVELRELFKILEYEPSKRSKKRLHQQKHRERNGKDDFDGAQSQREVNELYRISVTLQRGSLTLASDPETNHALLRDDPSYGHKYSPTNFLLGTFSQLQVAAVARDDTVVVDVSLQSIEAFDESAESSSFSRLLSRKQTIRPGAEGDDTNVNKLSGVVFLMNFEMNPANSRADASLVVHMEPLEIVLSPTARCWGRLAQFMDTPAALGLWAELEVASFNDIVNLKARTEAKLDYVMENRIALSIVLSIQAPVIIIPESDTDYNCARLIVDLGRINFRTDRLSQMDSDSVNFSSSSSAPMGRSGMGSLALMSPPHARNMNPNTSFVQQLYDEAEKGEGAIRWKEEFYDKFSLSVANVHVLLIPHGKTIRVQDDGLASSRMSYPSVSLPPYLLDMYDEEQEYELVERFNINVTVRTSILPLDATLTRFYVHADLPALTFNLSIEKYFQLVTLMDRFSVAAAKVPQPSHKSPDTTFYSTEDVFEGAAVGVVDPDDQYEAMRRASFLSTSALKKFMLDDNEGGVLSGAVEGGNDGEGGSDGNSSVESDDTWFSITSGNADMNLSSLGTDDLDDDELSLSDLSGPGSNRGISNVSPPPPRSAKKAKKRARLFTSGQATKLLDRKLCVCSFTVPVISIQLKKPRSTAVSSYASYRYDTSDFDDDPADNGTILIKLQGFRIRVGQKTLSTQVNVSLMSLEVEDFLDSSGRSTQFLMFSCPTITLPFSMKAPLRRGAKFPSYPSFRRRPNRQRERVISFQRNGPTSGGGPGSRGVQAPETLLEVVFSSLSDQKTGKEVLRDVDVQLGCVQFNFDQSYVCSLLELFEESSSQVALVPAPARNGTEGETFVSESLDGSPPPFELTPSIDQEYLMPMSLTESVRADLERARKNFFMSEMEPEAANTTSEDVAANRPLSVMLKLGARLHSLSICFSDRGESVASVAILDSQLQLGTAQAGQVNATGLVGDIKVFDLASKKSQSDGLGIAAAAAARGLESSAMDYIEIFGLDMSSSLSLSDSTPNMVSLECSIVKDGSVKVGGAASEVGNLDEKRSKSRLSLSVQPVRLLAQPQFVESVVSYILDGPLRAHFLSKRAVANYDDAMTPPRTTRNVRERRSNSSDNEFQLASSTPPLAPRTLDFRPESSTPFFDAVDATSRRSNPSNISASPAADAKTKKEASDGEVDKHGEPNADGFADEPGFDAMLANVLDKFDLDLTLFHPSILLPSASLKDMHASLQSQPCSGINVDFGAISVTLQGQTSPDPLAELNYSSREVTLDVKNLHITSVADQTAILDRSGFQMRCMLPTPWVRVEHSAFDRSDEKPAVSLKVEIHPICLNISETNVCVMLDVFYDTISPIFDTVQDAIRQIESDEVLSVFESASASDAETKQRSEPRVVPTGSARGKADWGRVDVNFMLEEFKVAFVSYSEAPHQFETWMKSIIDLPDEISSRDSSGNSVLQNSPRRQRYYSQHFMGRRGSFPNELPCCVIGEVALVSFEAKLIVDLAVATSADEVTPFECDFSLQEAIIRDKMTDQTEYLTHLFGPVPGAVVDTLETRASFSSEHSSFSLFSQESMPPPLLRTSTSQSSKLDSGSSQLSGRLVVKQLLSSEDGPPYVTTTNSLDVTVSSARVILLPRTLLRLEHFALDVFLAATKKTNELESNRDDDTVNNPPGMAGSGYAETGAEADDDRGDRQETRFGVPPLRSRKDSISESLKDELNVVRTAFMSPLQRMLSTASAKDGRAPGSYTSRVIAEESGDGASNSSGSKAAAGAAAADTRQKLLVPQWEVDARLLNLELWVVSTDRKADVTGCVLSSQLVAKFDSTVNAAKASASPDQNELVAATAKLSRVGVRIDSPVGDGGRATIPESPSKPGYSSGTLVESFDVDLRLHLHQCYRPIPLETIDPESSNESSAEKSEESTAAVTWIDTSSPGNNDDAVDLPELFLRDVPSEWEEWALLEPSIRVDQIVSHVAYRDLPLLLKISASMTSVLSAEQNVRNTFLARLKAASDGDWSEFPDTPGEYSGYAHYFDTDDTDDGRQSGDALSVIEHDVLTRASLHMGGVKFRLMNNIVDQESPVIDFDAAKIKVLLRAETNSMVEIDAGCKVEARYQNLRLVTMEPLIEPWSVGVTLFQQQHPRASGTSEAESRELSPWKLKISSNVFLDVNLTDAFIANMMAANRAWKWVVNAGGDSRETTEYSTYWIRNNTGLPLRYWGASYNTQSLAPGQEEPLRFNNVTNGNEAKNGGDKTDSSGARTRRNTHVRDRQLFIAVEEEYPSDSLSNTKRKWQSETPIPVDQVDSRMYALVDFEADLSSMRMRKCECVIDVLVEHGCKYFVVRSTLLLENQTASDLEVEFVPPQRHSSSSRSLRSGSSPPQGHVIPIWKKMVKASSVIPVPVHLVSSGEGYVNVRPPDMDGTDAGNKNGGYLPKAYAKERVYLPIFDRGTSSASGEITHAETDDSGRAQCTVKFRRLYSDRPVRPFMMTACLSNASSALYHRTLSFHPPLIVHNLTAGPLDYCLNTPNDWTPAVDAVSLTNAGISSGWETREQRLRERGTINVADSLIWHLSSDETPLELSVRIKGFEWSEPLELEGDLGDLVRIKMKDLVSDAHLFITAEIQIGKGGCRELFLYVPYWIVNLTGLKLEFEYDEERAGHEHTTMLLAGQKRLDREELLLKENQRSKAARRERNPHLLHIAASEDQDIINSDKAGARAGSSRPRGGSPDRRDNDRKRRHPRLLPSVPPVKGLLDLIPESIDNSRSLGQLEVLQACHSDYRLDRGCVRLRVNEGRQTAGIDARKESAQRKWSESFVLDQAGTIGEIEADDYDANRKYSIGYSITPAKGQYSRTKVIMLTPRFMLINTMSSAIEVCHSSAKMVTPSPMDMGSASPGHMQNSRAISPANPVVQLDAGAFADFHWTLRFAKSRTIRCRLAEYGWAWSGAVPLGESGEYAVRMRHESTRESKLVRVTLKLDASCVCVYFREERTTAPPYRVENYSLETLRIHQHRVRRSEILLPHHSLDYAWDEPTEVRTLVVDMLPSAAGDNSRPLRIGTFVLDKIGQYPDALGGTLGIEISTDGPTRVLRFTDTRLRGDKVMPTSTPASSDPTVSAQGTERGGLLSLQRFVAAPTLHATLQLQGIGISIVDGVPKELLYMSVSGVSLEVLMSEEDPENNAASIAGSAAALSRLERETRPRVVACRLQVGDVQVDNQLQMTPYPVLLRFSNPSGRSRIVNGQAVHIPVLELSLVKHDEYSGIHFIRHFSASVLPVHIRVDGSLLYQMLPLLVHSNVYGGNSSGSSARDKKRTVVLGNGGGDSDVSRAAHSHLLLEDFNASLEVTVKVLEAAQKDGTTSAGPSSAPTTPSARVISRRGSAQTQQQPIQQNQHTGLATEIQRYTVAKHGSLGAIASNDEEKKLYFEEFYIDPIRATVSFSFGDSAGAIVDGHLASLSHAAAAETSNVTVGPLRLILNAIGTSLTKIANAPFQLKALEIHNSFVQPDALATRLISHYQSEALRQAYVILGSVDVLGNPMIAWKNMRSGFADFVAEPAHGLTQRSPRAFAFGMGRGTLSLVRASVYTFLDFNTRILTAFSLGLSEACLKLDDYTGYPATRHIFQGLVQGVSGVVVAPIHSFELNGARGVFPGLVAGAFGVVLKPLLGFSLATATTAATLRDAVDPNTKALLVRARPPRHIDLRTKRLKVYSYVESLGEEIVGKIRGGRYRADGYLGHLDLNRQCFLVTRRRILLLDVRGTQTATKYDVVWELLAEEIVMVDCSRTPEEQVVTIYYMEDEFRGASGAGNGAHSGASGGSGGNGTHTHRRRTPGVPRGMFLQKHVVALPDTKVLFVRAMLQQQERSLLTKMNSYTAGEAGTPHRSHHPSPMPSATKAASMELSTSWQQTYQRMPAEYPVFRLPPSLHPARSFANLKQSPPQHQE